MFYFLLMPLLQCMQYCIYNITACTVIRSDSIIYITEIKWNLLNIHPQCHFFHCHVMYRLTVWFINNASMTRVQTVDQLIRFHPWHGHQLFRHLLFFSCNSHGISGNGRYIASTMMSHFVKLKTMNHFIVMNNRVTQTYVYDKMVW